MVIYDFPLNFDAVGGLESFGENQSIHGKNR